MLQRALHTPMRSQWDHDGRVTRCDCCEECNEASSGNPIQSAVYSGGMRGRRGREVLRIKHGIGSRHLGARHSLTQTSSEHMRMNMAIALFQKLLQLNHSRGGICTLPPISAKRASGPSLPHLAFDFGWQKARKNGPDESGYERLMHDINSDRAGHGVSNKTLK